VVYNIEEDKELQDVALFQKKFDILNFDTPGHLTRRKLQEQVECMLEELKEFIVGANEQDLGKQADALIDLVYFVKETAKMLGLPWKELWDDVQRANMEKERGVGPRGHKVDCIKPVGWQPPNTYLILRKAGYTGYNISELRDDPEYPIGGTDGPFIML
jgi:hypothetical protein